MGTTQKRIRTTRKKKSGPTHSQLNADGTGYDGRQAPILFSVVTVGFLIIIALCAYLYG